MRRGGRDRYRADDLKRGVVRDNYRPLGGWESPPLTVPLSMHVAARVTGAVPCRAHGIPWTSCIECSKPRAP